ncbi:MAG: c-type cytochrome domain-containing protein, partial [Pirellula sp.]
MQNFNSLVAQTLLDGLRVRFMLSRSVRIPISIVFWLFASASSPQIGLGQTESTKFFEENIRPLLVQHCIACHGPDKSESSLRLDQP